MLFGCGLSTVLKGLRTTGPRPLKKLLSNTFFFLTQRYYRNNKQHVWIKNSSCRIVLKISPFLSPCLSLLCSNEEARLLRHSFDNDLCRGRISRKINTFVCRENCPPREHTILVGKRTLRTIHEIVDFLVVT